MQQRPARLVSLEVSKAPLDSACRPEPTRWRVANDRAGLAHRRPLKPALLGRDASGDWQDAWVAALAVAKQPVAVVHPRHLRDVDTAPGPVAKTDARDAGVIAPGAAAGHPTPRPLPDARTPALEALVPRRRPHLAIWVAERHWLALVHPMVRDRLARPIDGLQRLIDETEAESSTVIRTTPAWREAADVRPSTPGLGPVRSATLHAALPELGVLHQRDIAPLVGVAPLHDARGQRAGARPGRGGRAEVRAV
jgi:transposase